MFSPHLDTLIIVFKDELNIVLAFDIIFIDPPYCREMIPEAIKIVKENNMLAEDGIIVTKIDSIEEIYEGYEDIKLFRSKKYGKNLL